MRYWPIALVAESPLMPAPYAVELRQIYARPPSEGAYYACCAVARHTPPMLTSLVIIETEGAPYRRVYTEYPGIDEWLRLERGGVVQGNNGGMFVIFDGIH